MLAHSFDPDAEWAAGIIQKLWRWRMRAYINLADLPPGPLPPGPPPPTGPPPSGFPPGFPAPPAGGGGGSSFRTANPVSAQQPLPPGPPDASFGFDSEFASLPPVFGGHGGAPAGGLDTLSEQELRQLLLGLYTADVSLSDEDRRSCLEIVRDSNRSDLVELCWSEGLSGSSSRLALPPGGPPPGGPPPGGPPSGGPPPYDPYGGAPPAAPPRPQARLTYL